MCCILISTFTTTALLIFLYNVDSTTDQSSHTGEFFFKIPTVLCAIMGYALYFSGMSMFVWMTLLNYELASSIHDLKIPDEDNNRVFTGRFLKYTLFGVGTTLFMTLKIFILDQLELNEINPGVGTECCFLTMSGIYYMPGAKFTKQLMRLCTQHCILKLIPGLQFNRTIS